MQNKLQELTDKLYNEGLSKGRQEAEDMKANAKNEAAKIIADAKKEAERIKADAEKDAEDLKVRVSNDIRMASVQTISAIKQQVEQLIITSVLAEPVKKGLDDVEFLKSVILTIAKAFNAANPEPASLSVILPESMRKDLDAFMKNEIAKVMGKNPEVTFSKQIAGGFKIGPKKDGYLISFSNDDFERILAEYLRPGTKKLLFG